MLQGAGALYVMRTVQARTEDEVSFEHRLGTAQQVLIRFFGGEKEAIFNQAVKSLPEQLAPMVSTSMSRMLSTIIDSP